MGNFQDQGTAVATAQMEGDSDKRAPPSHSTLRIKLDACLKSQKPRSFGGVDVWIFQIWKTLWLQLERVKTRTNEHHLRTQHRELNSIHD